MLDAIFFPCPACGAQDGEWCSLLVGVYMRTLPEGASPWCHTLRTQVMQLNARMDSFDLVLID